MSRWAFLLALTDKERRIGRKELSSGQCSGSVYHQAPRGEVLRHYSPKGNCDTPGEGRGAPQGVSYAPLVSCWMEFVADRWVEK